MRKEWPLKNEGSSPAAGKAVFSIETSLRFVSGVLFSRVNRAPGGGPLIEENDSEARFPELVRFGSLEKNADELQVGMAVDCHIFVMR